jgi:hypothetical protein
VTIGRIDKVRLVLKLLEGPNAPPRVRRLRERSAAWLRSSLEANPLLLDSIGYSLFCLEPICDSVQFVIGLYSTTG